jgi:surface protein
LQLSGNTIKHTGTAPNVITFVESNLRGTTEWFAVVPGGEQYSESAITGYILTDGYYQHPLLVYEQSPSTYADLFKPNHNTPVVPWNNIVTTHMSWVSVSNGSGVNNTTKNIVSWDTSNVITIHGFFPQFNQNINHWNVSKVTYASFNGCNQFNQPLNNWNTSNMNNMTGTFYGATAFNNNISGWNVSNVTDMTAAFSEATAFNQPIGNWNASKVTSMVSMFQNASAFNQAIGNWNVSNVTDMASMFDGATAFNQAIGDWNVSNVTDMSYMFQNATTFNQDLYYWPVAPGIPHTDFSTGATAFQPNYNPVWFDNVGGGGGFGGGF